MLLSTPLFPQNTITINLNNFDYNLNLINQLLFPSEIMLVVKANAYGHDIKIIESSALRNGIK